MAKKSQPGIKINEEAGRAQMKMLEGQRQRNYFKVSLLEDGENKCRQVEGNASLFKLIIQRITFLEKLTPCKFAAPNTILLSLLEKSAQGPHKSGSLNGA